MIDAMGIGLIIPVMPDLIREVQGPSLANAALWGGVMSTVFAVMQFLFGPILGSLSDQYGRRRILLISLSFMVLDYLLMAVAGTIWLLLLGRVIGGITAATQATASACMADISKPEDKAKNFGLIGAGFGAGFVLGPLVGGLLGEFGTRAPFYAAAMLAALNLALGYLVLRETVKPENRRKFDWSRANPFGAARSVSALPGAGRLLIVFLFFQLAFVVYPAVWSYYAVERFGWAPGTIGLSLALFGISFGIVQGALIGPIIKRFGERKTVLGGLIFDVAAFVTIGFISSGTVALILVPITSLSAVVVPALQGILSKQVGDDAQGELQGVLTSASAMAAIISPLLMTSAFASFTREGAPIYLPGAPFFLAAVLAAVALWVFVAWRAQDS
ncbi:MFS transporter [Pseudaestuariivita atlantica]|uniref:MFS transporter n=2 Tax=Pseudaestuariivita atlantica TaxID=1317121 RepID=A0A0L1JLT4_9RHOB|nr:MFS transporter [Pseudaestuariivita atlantica]